jgi:hypothetical protein
MLTQDLQFCITGSMLGDVEEVWRGQPSGALILRKYQLAFWEPPVMGRRRTSHYRGPKDFLSFLPLLSLGMTSA